MTTAHEAADKYVEAMTRAQGLANQATHRHSRAMTASLRRESHGTVIVPWWRKWSLRWRVLNARTRRIISEHDSLPKAIIAARKPMGRQHGTARW